MYSQTHHSSHISSKSYFPALDGVRAFAVIFVLLYHLGLLPGGFLGVDVFFVLSGYWITRILLREYAHSGTILVGPFIIRRVRRLLPACFFTLALITLIMWLQDDSMLGRNRQNIWTSLLFVHNWQQILTGTTYLTLFEPSFFRHFWSLSIEGQFYLAWTWIFYRLCRKNHQSDSDAWALSTKLWKKLFAAGFILLVGTLLYALQLSFLPAGDQAIDTCQTTPAAFFQLPFDLCVSRLEFFYLGTFTKLWPIACGIATAILLSHSSNLFPYGQKKSFVDSLSHMAIHLLGWSALVLIFILVINMQIHSDAGMGIGIGSEFSGEAHSMFSPVIYQGFPLIAIATAILIYSIVCNQQTSTSQSTLLSNMLASPLLVWIGQRSYGLYLLHWPMFLAFQDSTSTTLSWADGFLAVSFTLLLAELSYVYLENPIRKFGFAGFFLGRSNVAQTTNTNEPFRWSRGIVRSLGTFVILGYTGYLYVTATAQASPLENLLRQNKKVVVDLPRQTSAMVLKPVFEKSASKNIHSKKNRVRSAPPKTPDNIPLTEFLYEDFANQEDSVSNKASAAAVAETTRQRIAKETAQPRITSETEPAKYPKDSKQISATKKRKSEKSEPTEIAARIADTGVDPLADLRILAIGDSVMLGGALKLDQYGILVDARIRRQAPEALEIVQKITDDEDALPIDTLILHIGTNGRILPKTMAELLTKTQHIPHVIVLTLYGNRPWIESNNQLIRQFAEDFLHTSVLDWQNLAQQCSACLLTDGIHLDQAGQKMYANSIYKQILYLHAGNAKIPQTP